MDVRPPLLYLTHRIPYPPNKGDKVRSFHILQSLSRSYRVFLGTFVDHPDDRAYIGKLNDWCEGVHVEEINPRLARLGSLAGLLRGEALSLPYYRSRALHRWVGQVVAEHGIEQAFVFSGPMAQYLDGIPLRRRIIDFCDLDSAKWAQYAADRNWPMSWLYRREGRALFSFERRAAGRADASTFVTEAEADLFRQVAPELAERVVAIQNGVDADFFSPASVVESPYEAGGPVLVFTGAMDYWPNIDAVTWFAREIMPPIRSRSPSARFCIVGMNPVAEVRALASEGVIVTGTVVDVRPWLAHADVVVAPLRVARGIQNKVLEAMAMARPVVLSHASAVGLRGLDGRDFHTATTATEFSERIIHLLADADLRASTGVNARGQVLEHYSWSINLARFARLLEADYPPVKDAGVADLAIRESL